MTVDVFQDMAESIKILEIICGRKACIENLMHVIRDRYAVVGPFLINNDKNEAYPYY
jgi:hypothetical protein